MKMHLRANKALSALPLLRAYVSYHSDWVYSALAIYNGVSQNLCMSRLNLIWEIIEVNEALLRKCQGIMDLSIELIWHYLETIREFCKFSIATFALVL